MNTANQSIIPLLKPKKSREYEFILEDLELAFPKEQLKEITRRWNQGESVEFIAKELRRHQDEVFLAIYHQARRGVIRRRSKSTLMIPGKEQLKED